MAKEYKAPKIVNRFMMWLTRFGVGPSETLETTGWKSGQLREVPVTPIHRDGDEYIVAPYGEVSWVRNVRANPAATLRKGSQIRHVHLVDVTSEAAEVVKEYWDREKFPRPYMDMPDDATVDDFAGVAGRFPVFRVEEPE